MSTLPFIISLWNARGLRNVTVHDALSHVSNSYVLLITETWLYSHSILPTNWKQIHAYGRKVVGANNRGEEGLCALINPICPYRVVQLPSLNNYVLSIKVGDIRLHCFYLPPSMPDEQVIIILDSIPLLPNTFLCGDFNARIGELVGDYNSNPRGLTFLTWLQDRQLYCLNQSLSFGIPTFSTNRAKTVVIDGVSTKVDSEISSIIDLFVTNIEPSSLLNSTLDIKSNLSLSSDHSLMILSFDIESSLLISDPNEASSMAPRRLWNLSRFGKPDIQKKYRSSFQTLVAPLQETLTELVSSPPITYPPIDALNDSLNDCIYQSLDASIGTTPSRPSHWKKYWTQEIQNAVQLRDDYYRRWRQSKPGIDKGLWWGKHNAANKAFRSLVQKAKRRSWKEFCNKLQSNFSKATKVLSRIKKRHGTSASFSHNEGPTKALELMSSHLSSVYNGSSLPSNRIPNVVCDDTLPYDCPDNTFDIDDIKYNIKRMSTGKSPGPDHIKSEMLLPLVDLISPVLCSLFKMCLQWGYTPLLWRQATVFPIYKKGDSSDPANYRPISLTSVLRKLFERVIYYKIVNNSPPLDVAQGGFRDQRSPLDQALCLHDLMHDYFLVHHHYPSVAFLDIKSAYDTVDRRIVWQSLYKTTSFSRPILWLLMNMFDDVSISVLLSNQSSSSFVPVTGLLQGSVLSPHLYSIYINTLPGVLRQVASDKTSTVTLPGDSNPIPLNCLLFADDVAIFGTKNEVQSMLNLAAQHSLDLGYRWNPSKCAVLNAPSPTSSSSLNFYFKLYDVALPTVDQFTYLGMEFNKKGLHGPGILEKRSAGAIKTMALLTSVGANRNGYSLLFCSRLYTCFIRPKIEYGLAISKLTHPNKTALDALQNKLVRMFLGSSHVNVAKHITCLPAMSHRYNSLVTRYAVRSDYLPDDSLVVLLRDSLRRTRLVDGLKQNPYYLALPDPRPTAATFLKSHFQKQWQAFFDKQLVSWQRSKKMVLLRACRPSTSKPDPILFLKINKSARSRLVRWRLGSFTAMARNECPCQDFGAIITRDHFLTCRSIDPALFESLPVAPPGVHRIDYAINQLPNKSSLPPPAFWPDLLTILWLIDTLCHPSKNIPADPHPGTSWLNYPRPNGS